MRPSARDRWRGPPARVVSALLLAPPALVALYVGPPLSDALVLLVAAVASWEWARLCGRGRIGPAEIALIASVVATSIVSSLGAFGIASWLIVTGAAACILLAARAQGGSVIWHAIGVAYLAAAVMAFLWLRADPATGRATILWLIAVVWATDVAAFLAGSAIGGPRLLPRVSPGKTWAGLVGGMLAAAGAGVAVALALGLAEPGRIAAMSAALAVAAQVGDLFESHLKRRFGAKDSSNLIPGHGGVLDRIDGLLAVALVIGGAVRVTGGMGIAWS